MTTKVLALAVLLPALALGGCSRQAPATAPPPGGKEMVFKPGAPPPGAKLVWPVPQDPAASIRAAGLAQLSREGEIWHLHAHLEVFKDGQQVIVPADIGVGGQPGAQFFSPLHTHTPDGVVHVESNEIKDYTLGQFFAQWGVPLAGATVTVNGEAAADPAAVVFHNLDLVTVEFGRAP